MTGWCPALKDIWFWAVLILAFLLPSGICKIMRKAERISSSDPQVL